MAKTKDLSKNVMKAIHDKHIRMRPKVYFVLGSLFLGIGLAGILITTAFFINLIFFRFGLYEPFDYLRFGRFGIRAFLQNIPWWPILLGISGIVGGLALLKYFDISYKKSFLGLSSGLIAMIFILGFVLNRINFNRRVSQLKPLKQFYQEKPRSKDWLIGKIIEINDERFLIMTSQGEQVNILIEKSTICPLGRDFKVGTWVKVVGEKKGDLFITQGVSPVGSRFLKWRQDYFKNGFPSPRPVK